MLLFKLSCSPSIDLKLEIAFQTSIVVQNSQSLFLLLSGVTSGTSVGSVVKVVPVSWFPLGFEVMLQQ